MVSTNLLFTLILTFTLTVPLVRSEEIAPLEQDLQKIAPLEQDLQEIAPLEQDLQKIAPLEKDLQVHEVVNEVDRSYDFKDEQSAPEGRLKDRDEPTKPCCEGSEGNGGFLDGLKNYGSFAPIWSKSNPLKDKDKPTKPHQPTKPYGEGSEENVGFLDSLKQYGSFVPIWSKSNPDTGIGYSSSTVYAFSYENLFIIVAIKALLAFALFGGFGFAPFLGRSLEHPDTTTMGNLLGGAEDLLFTLAYLSGRPEEGYTCLQRQACLRPARGEDILLASVMVENGVHLVQRWTSGTVSSPHSALSSLEEALDYSYSGGDCRERFYCSAMPSL